MTPDPLLESFEQTVIEPFAVQRSSMLDYESYMGLSSDERLGDEANVVDQRFTTALLSWLGWSQGDFDYNAPESGGGKRTQRPDFRVKSMGVTAFVVEDKASGLSFDAGMLDQMRRYAEGSTGYALWCNARELRLERFWPGGTNETLAVCSVVGLFGSSPVLDRSNEEAALLQIHSILGKQRFTDFPGLMDQVSYNGPRISLEGETALREFISGSRSILDEVRRGAVVQIRAALNSRPEFEDETDKLRVELEEANRQLLQHSWSEVMAPRAREATDTARTRLGTLSADTVKEPLREASGVNAQVVTRWAEQVMRLDSLWRLTDQQHRRQQTIATAYELWTRQQPDQATNVTPETFAEQVAYVLFVRLILVRLLEDRGIIPNRLAVNGGFEAWRDLIETRFAPPNAQTITDIYGAEFLTMVFRVVGSYYRHFFQQPIFDWYQPDDIALVKLLAHLNRYDFGAITHDVLGFTYENYVDRRGRGKKGHFLTRSGVVTYMLDQAGYENRNIIGRSFLDHACGSGSFLIHATRRYRQALAEGMAATEGCTSDEFLYGGDDERRLRFARKLIDDVTHCLVGIDIDPFACYLAELNLLIQVLDEVSLVWENDRYAPIERFLVFNSDGLSMPTGVLNSSRTEQTLDIGDEDPLDEAWSVKARQEPWNTGFDYVVANPPYVTPKRQPVLDQVRNTPFFREVLAQDLNLYLLFFRLAEHYLSDTGVAVLIVPLTVLGDDSAENTRRLLNGDRLRLTGITRFYSGTVLFPGVDQMVSVIRFEAGNVDRPAPEVELRGGLNEGQAASDVVRVSGSEVVAPPKPEFSPRLPDPWTNPWLHVADSEGFTLWQHVCERAGANVHHLLDVSLSPRQGDVNTNAVKPLRRESPGANRIPAYTGKSAHPLAPLREPEVWLEVPDQPRSTGHEAVLASLINMTDAECGIVLQEAVNLHVGRRLRATWFERDGDSPKAFQHTLWRFTATAGKERHAKATLGFLSSSLASYLFGLWATNFHVQSNVLRRLPCPPLDTFPEEELASATDTALSHRAEIADAISNDRGKFTARGEVKLSPTALLESSAVPTLSLADAELRGLITRLPSSSQRVARLLDGYLYAQDPDYFAEVELLIAEYSSEQWDRAKTKVDLPEPGYISAFVAFRDKQTQQVEQAAVDFAAARKDIDRIVADWYELPDDLKSLVNKELPFSYRNARAMDEDEDSEDLANIDY